jgi:hypothetical protein
MGRGILVLEIRLAARILSGGDGGNVPELVLVVGGFQKHGIADLLLLVAAVALYASPHAYNYMETC